MVRGVPTDRVDVPRWTHQSTRKDHPLSVSLLLFRDDLRVADNPALYAAAEHGHVVGLYVLDQESAGIRPLGGAGKWWLHHALADLRQELAALGIPLLLRRGAAHSVVTALAEELGAVAVFWNRRYGGPERTIDAGLKSWAAETGRTAQSFQANLLHEPWNVTTGSGTPYRVFTPFWRTLSSHDFRQPLSPPPPGRGFTGLLPVSEELDEWALLPTAPDWAAGLRATWQPTAAAGHELLADFLETTVTDYEVDRDRPDMPGTSRLSPYLRWGQLSPFQVWDALSAMRRGTREDRGTRRGGDRQLSGPESAVTNGPAVFASELGWREFCWHQLFHNPDLARKNLRSQFDDFPWRTADDPDAGAPLTAWQRGRTGIPLVDAGQRELWHTGYMHNRVRMVTASFLIKNLGFDWREGEAWFWDTLVDADAASNPANWQWVAGSGADAAPYFRIFNPQTQAKKFDPEARYITRWVPEVATPDYPEPLVDLQSSRKAALEDYASIKK